MKEGLEFVSACIVVAPRHLAGLVRFIPQVALKLLPVPCMQKMV